jgi:hypothetical protein
MPTVWVSRDCDLRSRVIAEALTVGGEVQYLMYHPNANVAPIVT